MQKIFFCNVGGCEKIGNFEELIINDVVRELDKMKFIGKRELLRREMANGWIKKPCQNVKFFPIESQNV